MLVFMHFSHAIKPSDSAEMAWKVACAFGSENVVVAEDFTLLAVPSKDVIKQDSM